MELSVIVPVYNEVDAIEGTIEQLHDTLKNAKTAYELIIVNDGSTDGTKDKLELLKKLDFVYVGHETNRGYGAAIKSGVLKSKYQNIVITDADGTYPIKEIPGLASELNEFDMVVGHRAFSNLPNKTKPAKWFISRMANYVAETRIPDINSGLRAFRKKSFNCFLSIIPNGFSLTTTITLGMFIGGFSIKYIPIEYYDRKGKSKIKPIRDTYNFLRLILKIGLFLAPLKIFLPVSYFLVFAGIAWGLFSWLYLGTFADSSTIIILVSSLQVLMLALVAEIINHRTPNFYKKTDND
jgi:glycosyltransferase involved in cell wall biosynthesis